MADPRAVRFRVLVMSAFAQDADFVRTALRPTNIVSAAVKKGALDSSKAWDEDGLQSDEGSALWAAVVRQRPLAEQACQAEDKEGLIAAVRPLAAPIDAFFDSTMVMVDDPAVRNARLGMLAECDAVFKLAGDFTKVVIPG